VPLQGKIDASLSKVGDETVLNLLDLHEERAIRLSFLFEELSIGVIMLARINKLEATPSRYFFKELFQSYLLTVDFDMRGIFEETLTTTTPCSGCGP
jgi:hypothetical protein